MHTCGKKPTLEQGRTYDPVGKQHQSSLFPEELHPVGKGYKLKQFVESCCPWDRLTLVKLMEKGLPQEGQHGGAGEDLLSQNNGRCNKPTVIPIPCLPAQLEGRK